MNKDYKNLNAEAVLKVVENKISNIDNMIRNRYCLFDVYRELSIFDWWHDYLSKSQLQDMRKFLREAIKLGYTGYVCFKVGASGCANGMWAYKNETTDGYSPDGDAIYKSFVSTYNYWQVKKDGVWYPDRNEYDTMKTIKQFENLIMKLN